MRGCLFSFLQSNFHVLITPFGEKIFCSPLRLDFNKRKSKFITEKEKKKRIGVERGIGVRLNCFNIVFINSFIGLFVALRGSNLTFMYILPNLLQADNNKLLRNERK